MLVYDAATDSWVEDGGTGTDAGGVEDPSWWGGGDAATDYPTAIDNPALPGDPGYGWTYYTDGTVLAPTGEYYLNGESVYAPSGAALDPNILVRLASAFGVTAEQLPALLSGATNSDLGLGVTGVLGALAALTDEPSTTSGTTTQSGTTGQTTSGTTQQDTSGTTSGTQTGTTSGTSAQTQTGAQTGTTSGTSSQTQTGAQTGTQSGTSAQTQTGTQTGTQSGTSAQTQTGMSLQEQLQNVLQQMQQTTSQEQTGNTTQQQTGTTAQRTAQVLPEWYLNMVRGQAEGLGDLAPMEAFDKTMLDMPIDQYMNPYLTQVADPIMRRQAEDQARQQQEFDAQRVARGAFGTDRAAILENQMLERQALERDNTLGQLYSQAFGNAQGVAGTDLTRMFQEWQAMQQDPRALAQMQANTLMTLNPGAVTETSGTTTSLSDMLNRMLTAGSTTGTTATGTTGTTTGSTTGSTLGSTTGTTSGSTTGSTLGSTTGLTSGTTTGSTIGSTTGLTSGSTTGTTTGSTTGSTTGTTAGTTGTTGTTSYTGADPNRLGQLAGLTGTIWGLANP